MIMIFFSIMFIIDLDDLSGAIGSDVTYIHTQSMIYSYWGPRQSFKKWGLGIDFENQDTGLSKDLV